MLGSECFCAPEHACFVNVELGKADSAKARRQHQSTCDQALKGRREAALAIFEHGERSLARVHVFVALKRAADFFYACKRIKPCLLYTSDAADE